MKRLLFIALTLVPLLSMAQDDDLYFVSGKQAKKVSDKKLRESFRKDPDRQYSVYGSNSFNDDDYNRRGVLSNSHYQISGGAEIDTLSSDSSMLMALADSLSKASNVRVKSYSTLDDVEDYYYSRRMARLRHNYYYHSPYYWDVYCGSYWYDPWYDPWFYHHGWGWYNSWYDPWFYGYSWYGWNPWYYGWYAGYGPHYWHYYHHWDTYYYAGYYGHASGNYNFNHRSSGVNASSNGRFTPSYANTYGGVRNRNSGSGDGFSASSRYGVRGGSLSSRYGYSPNSGNSNTSSSNGSSRRTLYNPGNNSNRNISNSSNNRSYNYNNSSSTRSSYSSSSSSSYSSGGGGVSRGSSYSSGGAGSRGGGGGGGRR